jgi:hypothetical protein
VCRQCGRRHGLVQPVWHVRLKGCS